MDELKEKICELLFEKSEYTRISEINGIHQLHEREFDNVAEGMLELFEQRLEVVTHDTAVISIEPKYLIRAGIWYTNHKKHVDKLVKEKGFKYPPTDEYDVRNPNVWKPAHWKWFIQNYL